MSAEALEGLSHSVHINNLVQVPVLVNSTSLLDERRDEGLGAVFADEFGWGVVGLSDLEHNVVVVRALGLTLLAQVVIRALGALVADADNITLAHVADEALMNLLVLLVVALVFLEDVLEAAAPSSEISSLMTSIWPSRPVISKKPRPSQSLHFSPLHLKQSMRDSTGLS